MNSDPTPDEKLLSADSDKTTAASEQVPSNTEETPEYPTWEAPNEPEAGEETDSDENDDDAIQPWPTEQYGPEWRMWPPSPKMQIVLIAVAFGIFNCILIGIWAVVMVNNN